jgi:zinc/manganese transport system substrate-binding protein
MRGSPMDVGARRLGTIFVMKTVSGFVMVAVCAVLLAACGGPADPTKGARIVNVVAAEDVWANVAAQIGGRHARVTSLINDPAADPHLFSADALAAGRVSRANLAVVNGLGYDDFANKLLDAAPSSKRRVLTIADVLRASGNPHLWYDAPRLPAVARAIAGALAAQDPRDTALFRAGATRFVRSLRPLDAAIASIRARHRAAPVAYTERVAGYLLDAAGLRVLTPAGYAQAIEDGSEPSPGDAKRMDDLIGARRVRALVYNAQATSTATRGLRALAVRSGVPVVAVTETLPRGERFQAWQARQARALLEALDR